MSSEENIMRKLRESRKLKESGQIVNPKIEDIKNSTASESFMRDRAQLKIDGQIYNHLNRNKWEHVSMQAHTFGGIFTDDQMYNNIKKAKSAVLIDESRKLKESDVLNEVIYIQLDANKVAKVMRGKKYGKDELLNMIFDIYGLEDGEDYQLGNGDLEFGFLKNSPQVQKLKRDLGESKELKEGRYTGTTTVRRTAETVLQNHGLNNSVGRYDKFVNKMWNLYKETLLDKDRLLATMEKEFQKMYPNLKESHDEEDSQEELDEDWRNKKFDGGDLKLYSANMVKDAERLAFSINMMSEKYPQYSEEFKGLKKRIIKRFQ